MKKMVLLNGKADHKLGGIMPSYDFKNTETGEVTELFMKISELDEYKKNNPHMKQQVSAPKFNTRADGDVLKKAGDGWKEVQQRIQSGLPPRLKGNIKTK